MEATAQDLTARCFPQSGHTVSGAFLRFFETRGGLDIFGYPLTEAFVENGLTVQYFQRAKMEWHPNNPPNYRVQLALLGDLIGSKSPPISKNEIPSPRDSNRRYYPQTGHTISFSFLRYFDTRGGLDIFGYPISELLVENGLIVQYFQRARMEWHPNLNGGSVLLGLLGDEYLKMYPAPFTVSQAQACNQRTLTLRAWPKYPLVGRSGFQTIYITVLDEEGRPVADAQGNVVVHLRERDALYSITPTNDRGFTSVRFPLDTYSPRGFTTYVDVTMSTNDATGTTRTKYLNY